MEGQQRAGEMQRLLPTRRAFDIAVLIMEVVHGWA